MMRARYELDLFLVAAAFLTRLPAPAPAGWREDRLVRAARYFGAVGALVGLLGGLVWWLAGAVLPAGVAAGLAVAAMIALTGALHEDGLADCADGLGGGGTREAALAIMRDSRTGSYGVIALLLSVGLRWAALAALAPVAGVLALALAAGIGRALMVPATALARYARAEGVGAMVARGAEPTEVGAALATALVLGLLGGWAGLLALVLAMVVAGAFLAYMAQRIGGYTGDALGAIAQLGEVTVMVTLAGAWA